MMKTEPETERDRFGRIILEQWFNDNKVLHRLEGPAKINYVYEIDPPGESSSGDYSRRFIKTETWYVNGIPSRDDDEPHVVITKIRESFPNKTLLEYRWLDSQGRKHRVEKAASIEFNTPSPGIVTKTWFRNGKPYREDDKPTREVRSETFLISLSWLDEEGRPHRESDVLPAEKYWSKPNVLSVEKWMRGGKLSRYTDKPSYISYHPNRQPSVMKWLVNDVYKRDDDKPTEVKYSQDGTIVEEAWYSDKERIVGSISRFGFGEEFKREGDQPALIKYYDNGKLKSQKWFINGLEGREGDKPSLIEYYQSGNISKESWTVNGKKHRSGDQPAVIAYFQNGEVSSRGWFKEGLSHRENGPSTLEYNMSGRVTFKSYFINGMPSLPPRREMLMEKFETLLKDRPGKIAMRDIPICNRIFKPNPSSSSEFKQTIIQLKEECETLESTVDCNDYYERCRRGILKEADTMITSKFPTIETTRGGELSTLFGRGISLFSNIDKMFVKFKGERGIDDGGLRRQFVLNICEQLRPLFEYLNQGGTDPRMYISRKPDQEIIDKIGQGFKLENLLLIYEFAGALFGHAVINEYSTEIPLSRLMLSAMVSEDSGVSTQDLMTYYLLENDTDDAMDRMYQMAPTSPEYVEEFIKDTASERYLFENLSGKAHPGKVYMDAFINGFVDVSEYLSVLNITPGELFRNVCKTNITPEKFKDFLERIVVFDEIGPVNKQFVIDTLSNKDEVLYNFLKEKVGEGEVSRDQLLVDFYKGLLKYWSESNVIDSSQPYTIKGTSIIPADFFPHTCSYTMDINVGFLNERNAGEFLERLFEAMKDTMFSTS